MFNFKNGSMNAFLVKQLDKMIEKDPAGADKMVQSLLSQYKESDADAKKSAIGTLDALYKTAKQSKCKNVIELIDRVKKDL